MLKTIATIHDALAALCVTLRALDRGAYAGLIEGKTEVRPLCGLLTDTADALRDCARDARVTYRNTTRVEFIAVATRSMAAATAAEWISDALDTNDCENCIAADAMAKAAMRMLQPAPVPAGALVGIIERHEMCAVGEVAAAAPITASGSATRDNYVFAGELRGQAAARRVVCAQLRELVGMPPAPVRP